MTLKIEPTRGSYFKITLNDVTICECMTRPQAAEKFEFLSKVYDAGWHAGNHEGWRDAMIQVYGEWEE